MKSYIAHENQKLAFKEAYEAFGVGSIAPDYLAGAHCRVFLYKGKIVAGYLLNDKAPFRYNEFIGKELLQEGRFIESCCFFMKLTSEARRAQVYHHMLRDLLDSGYENLVVGTAVAKLAPIMRSVFPQELYAGPNNVLGTHQWIFAVTRAQLIPRYMTFVMRRVITRNPVSQRIRERLAQANGSRKVG
jgi:hypothetical protein